MNDDTHEGRTEHRAEIVYDIPATVEEVWNAIATAQGISSWMTPTSLDPRVGGEVTFDFGGFSSRGTVTAYEPERRIAFEEPWPLARQEADVDPVMAEWFARRGIPLSHAYADLEQASPIATEFIVEAQSGGSCVVRIVTSAFGTGADWENEFFAEMVETTRPIWDGLRAHFASAAAR